MFFIKNGEPLEEGYIFDSKDIKYRVDEFESGDIKTLFVTGMSGSGKSTAGHKYEKDLGIPCYELDDLGINHHFTDAQLREYGPEMSGFFKGPGKKYRLHPDPKNPKWITDDPDWDEVEVSAEFIKYILSKKARCIVEGIGIFMAIDEKRLSIEDFKDSAMIIKGTAAVKSTYRAIRRDYINDKKEDPNLKLKDAVPFHYLVSRIKYMLQDEKMLSKMRKWYK